MPIVSTLKSNQTIASMESKTIYSTLRQPLDSGFPGYTTTKQAVSGVVVYHEPENVIFCSHYLDLLSWSKILRLKQRWPQNHDIPKFFEILYGTPSV